MPCRLASAMSDSHDNEYQDPQAIGSLSDALLIWLALRARREEAVLQHVVFTLACPSQSRAHRVASSLRRRLACAITSVSRVASPDRDTWHVHGSTHGEFQSLPRLERHSTWLRRTATNHQVNLVRLALVRPA